ncbi:UNVERIFIED_ORG: hypothetical protein ABIB52_001757 [Arthrobacter sp. UYCu721]
MTLWNTVYLDHALTALREQGYPVLDADVVRPSAYARRHINVPGHYSFQLPDLAGGRRTLRDPDHRDSNRGEPERGRCGKRIASYVNKLGDNIT